MDGISVSLTINLIVSNANTLSSLWNINKGSKSFCKNYQLPNVIRISGLKTSFFNITSVTSDSTHRFKSIIERSQWAFFTYTSKSLIFLIEPTPWVRKSKLFWIDCNFLYYSYFSSSKILATSFLSNYNSSSYNSELSTSSSWASSSKFN